MHNDYSDITSRISEAPSWFDTNGVPRYGAFEPKRIPDIYCDECALIEIACQDCGKHYNVALSSGKMARVIAALRTQADLSTIQNRPIAAAIRAGDIGYGDPPNCLHTEGCAGPTMTSDAIRVLEYWSRNDPKDVDPTTGAVANVESYFTWRRDTSLEIAFPDANDE